MKYIILSVLAVVAFTASAFSLSVGSVISNTASVELGILELSPKGESGGFAMPASGCSGPDTCPAHGARCVISFKKNPVIQGEEHIDDGFKVHWWRGSTAFRDNIIFLWPDGHRTNNHNNASQRQNVYSVNLRNKGLSAGAHEYTAVLNFEPDHVVSCTKTLTVLPDPASAPDLIGLNTDYVTYVQNEPQRLSASIQNVGTTTAQSGTATGNFPMTIYFDYNRDGYGGVHDFSITRGSTPLAPDEIKSFVSDVVFEQAGNWRARVQADSSNRVAEFIESNNYSAGDPFIVTPVVLPECSDTVDNDGDGIIDFSGGDPGCDDADDPDETDAPALPECSDTVDNDGDGIIDFSGGDPGCDDADDPDETDGPGGGGPSLPPTIAFFVSNITDNPGTWYPGNITIDAGDEISLRWVSRNDPDSCTGYNFSTGGATVGRTVGADGVTEPAPDRALRYRVTCSKAGFANVTALLDVSSITTGISGSPEITADPDILRVGDATTLTWNTEGADPSSCTVEGPGLGVVTGLSADTGTFDDVVIYAQSTYTITCSNGVGTEVVRVLPVIQET